VAARELSEHNRQALVGLADADNPYAKALLRSCAPAGQTFLKTATKVLEKPANQDVVNILLDVLRSYHAPFRPEGDPDLTFEELVAEAQQWLAQPDEVPELLACLSATQGLQDELKILRVLSGLGYGVLRPIFSKTDSIGSLMRRKLEPVSSPLMRMLKSLQA
jgi:hypothetical protein